MGKLIPGMMPDTVDVEGENRVVLPASELQRRNSSPGGEAHRQGVELADRRRIPGGRCHVAPVDHRPALVRWELELREGGAHLEERECEFEQELEKAVNRSLGYRTALASEPNASPQAR